MKSGDMWQGLGAAPGGAGRWRKVSCWAHGVVVRAAVCGCLSAVGLVLVCCLGGRGSLVAAADRPPQGVFERFGAAQLVEDRPAPSFALKDLRDGTVRLEELRGRLVLVNFWATWCAPCEREMPSLEALYRRYQGRAFALLAVSTDTEPFEGPVRAFVADRRLTFPILLDTALQTSRAYGVRGIPVSFLVGADGRLLGQVVGPRNWATPEAAALIDHLLAQTR